MKREIWIQEAIIDPNAAANRSRNWLYNEIGPASSEESESDEDETMGQQETWSNEWESTLWVSEDVNESVLGEEVVEEESNVVTAESSVVVDSSTVESNVVTAQVEEDWPLSIHVQNTQDGQNVHHRDGENVHRRNEVDESERAKWKEDWFKALVWWHERLWNNMI